jgi:hypothetical protein
MSNISKPASATTKEKKLLLFADDLLINALKPDHYVIVEPGSLRESDFSANSADASDVYEDEPEDDPENPFSDDLKAPSLSDITLVSKTIITDKNKNQFVEFVFNVKNSGGNTVIGAEVYGQ